MLGSGRLGGRSGSSAAGGVDGHHGDVLGLPVLPIVSRAERSARGRRCGYGRSDSPNSGEFVLVHGTLPRTLAGPRGIAAGANVRAGTRNAEQWITVQPGTDFRAMS